MTNRALVVIRHIALSMFLAPVAIEFAVIRHDVISHESFAAMARDCGLGYIFVLLSFGASLAIAGLVSGAAAALSSHRKRLGEIVSVAGPILTIPASVLASFFVFTTGVPLIQNGDRYIIFSAIGGVVVGLLTLLWQRPESRPTLA